MPFTLSEEEALIQKTVREFARQRIGLEAAQDFDRHDRFPDEPVRQAAELGLLGMTLSEDQGGAGTPPTAFALAVQELAAVCPNTAAVLAHHNAALRLLAQADEDAQAVRGAAAAGELVAILATEETHGSDKDQVGTLAEPDGDGYRITGHKSWVTSATHARHLVVLASVPEQGPAWFHVPADAAGVDVGRAESLMGLRACGLRAMYLHDVEVPAEALLVRDGPAAWRQARPWLQVGAAAAIVGCVQGASEAAFRFAEDRHQFGKPIGSFQAVSGTVTLMDTRRAAAESLLLRAAARLGEADQAPWAARAKVHCNEAGVDLTRWAIRVQGGTGFMREGGTERFARDARALQFVGEPEAVQRDVLKRHLLDIPFEPGP